jgi:hypothetical protein
MEGKICPNCGVELDTGMDTCPLCSGDTLREKDPLQSHVGKYPSEILKMSARERARYNWELSGIIAASGIIVSIIVDLVIAKGLNWSLFSVTLLAGIWIYITCFVFLKKKVLLLIPALAINTLLIQLVIDFINRPVNWFIPLALPFTISFFILVSILVLLWGMARYKGFNLLALIFVAISIQCFVFEIFTDLFINGSIHIEWSAITASAIIPFSAILIFLHYRLKRGLNLKSYFHV